MTMKKIATKLDMLTQTTLAGQSSDSRQTQLLLETTTRGHTLHPEDSYGGNVLLQRTTRERTTKRTTLEVPALGATKLVDNISTLTTTNTTTTKRDN